MTPVFSGKSAQKKKVAENVAAKGFLPRELVNFEVDWFYDSLGIEVCSPLDSICRPIV